MAGLEDEEEENYVRVKRPDTQAGSPEGPGEAASGLAATLGVLISIRTARPLS